MSLWSRLRGDRQRGAAGEGRWAVVVASPRPPEGDRWGDTWFGRDLVAALRRAGKDAHLVHRGGAQSQARDRDDVVIVLRGLRRVRPRRTGSTTWLLWVISHPELVDDEELAEYDAVFAASTTGWRGATPLLQATDPQRFTPDARSRMAPAGERVLFVGSVRGAGTESLGHPRPVVADAIAAGASPAIWGGGWEDLVARGAIDASLVRGASLPNEELPAAYASAGIVLNDHWADMAGAGFLSNRLFDAVAAGAVVVSDDPPGLHAVLPSVRTYRTVDELRALLTTPSLLPDAQERTDAAAAVARDHSFDARAAQLIAAVEAMR